ncbi:tRNA (adenosine(37)-N6)-dimethylallyltransferase MiaA [Chitinibacter sp. S2-10]|uniref:tRNA (adenosine(37)-N6)-dimethylallyltransferase MiaA n=1 Tax=Chitinibacter sp. S2-10 TaxID=3373597 RepID=UPI00397775D2
MQPYRDDLKPLARELRQHQTDAEQKLWQRLRRQQLGVTFNRQKPLLDFIVDFYCASAKLIVEIDGSQHLSEQGRAEDLQRTRILEKMGLSVLRFDNRQVLNEIDAVVEVIARTISAKIPPNPPSIKGGTKTTERKNSALNLTSATGQIDQINSSQLAPPSNGAITSVPPFEKGGLGGISAPNEKHRMPTQKLPPAIFIMGPTASGKTAAAMHLLESSLPVELISVDSALVFRDMNVGTAKPTRAELLRAPHHLIDIIDPTEVYSAAQFRSDARALMDDITARGKIPVLVGGTMLYFNTLEQGIHDLPEADAALREQIHADAMQLGWPAMHERLAALDPITATRLSPNDSQRIERAIEICILAGRPMSAILAEPAQDTLAYNLLKIALLPSDRAVLHQRIEARYDTMLAGGLVDEVKMLREKYALNLDLPSMRCVGYRQTWEYLDGEADLKTSREKGIAATRQLAKRQMTWLRGMDGLSVLDCSGTTMSADTLKLSLHFLQTQT